MSDDAALEKKKEQMRQYMAADREMDAEKDRLRRGRKGGCLVSLLKAMAFMGVVGLVVYGIWVWHPWSTEVVTTTSTECSPGVSGTRTTEYFTIFGMRVYESGQSHICME